MSKPIERVYLRGDFGATGLYCKAHDVDQLEAKYASLLGTLKGVMVLAEYHGLGEAVLNELRAAIAKAEGGSHE